MHNDERERLGRKEIEKAEAEREFNWQIGSLRDVGWICPRCQRVNAPWKGKCECGKERPYSPTMEIKRKG